MNKLNNLLTKLSLPLIISTPILTVSCASYDYSKLKSERPSGFDYVPKIIDQSQIKTDKIIESILNQQFKNDEVGKTEFIKSQENNELLLQELAAISKEYSRSMKQETIAKFNDFYTKNWMFLLKNIDKLTWKYTNWWTLEPKGNAKHSESFIENLDNKEIQNDFKFTNNYLDKLEVGDESRESPDDVFYLKKDKLIIRMFITRQQGTKKVIFDKFIYFPWARNNNIAIKLISDIVHNAIIHHNQEGYNSFEHDLVVNYGLPELGVLILGDKNEI
ncbi:Uncharacterised protein [Mycoplasmopsis bovigenitalium]|uniref:Lipoprotein n=1 Tax=Mycoplasmopsis bovigenitalium TaxID=2112 RepID=A0A449AA18_9BACT|nr:aromatic motif membrane protein [Mycoplasmopsis bovigenitalium]VEU61020.1 Uncharacterised protein [Mycoplasmopsis bovigenitalium]